MDALQDDIQQFNEQLLRLGTQIESGEHVLKLLDAAPEVIQKITAATAPELATAVQCHVPLVMFTKKAEELLCSDTGNWPEGASSHSQSPLQGLTHFALELARSIVHVEPVIAQLHFGLTRAGAKRLGELGITHLRGLSYGHSVLLQLRAGKEPLLWDRLLIGKRCSGARAQMISQQAALSTLGMK